MTLTSVFVFVALVVWGVASTFYMIKFLRLVMVLEDLLSEAFGDYDETIDALLAVEEGLVKVINMPIFFDNPELRKVIDQAKSDTTLSRLIVRRLAEKLVRKSKNKDIIIETVEEKSNRTSTSSSEEEAIDPEEMYRQLEADSMSPEDINFLKSVNSINSVINQKTTNKTVFGRSF
jgi:hypothetical protein